VTEKFEKEQTRDISAYKLAKEYNIHQLALKKNFFGLYHFSDSKNNPMPILIGCLLARNFVLFNQLLANCKRSYKFLNHLDSLQALSKSTMNPLDGNTLLHALAQASINNPQAFEDDQTNKDEEESMSDEEKDSSSSSEQEEESSSSEDESGSDSDNNGSSRVH